MAKTGSYPDKGQQNQPGVALSAPLRKRLLGYRIVAWTVGIFLLVLTLIGMPAKYLAEQSAIVAVVGPVHGFGYMVYLAVTGELARWARWSWRPTILVLLAGTVPFLSFMAERIVVRRTHAGRGL